MAYKIDEKEGITVTKPCFKLKNLNIIILSMCVIEWVTQRRE